MKADPAKPKGFIGSLNCAIEGILWAAKKIVAGGVVGIVTTLALQLAFH